MLIATWGNEAFYGRYELTAKSYQSGSGLFGRYRRQIAV